VPDGIPCGIVLDVKMMRGKRIKYSNKSDSKWSNNICLSDWITYVELAVEYEVS
jgi:hypothetical protein